MAGNKINTKKKEEKGKSGRIAGQSIEETEDLDFSLLRKPIHTSITGFAQARKIFDLATEELKGLLSNECDLLYECKVCRNIFRSLANFISHKRVYCKGKFNPSEHGHFIKNSSSINEILKIRKLEEIYQEALNKDNDSNGVDVEENDQRIPLTKDLTDIVERISNTKGVDEDHLKDQKLVFQKIPKSSVAVFQNIDNDENKSDTMKAQVKELDRMLSQENAVLQSDGSFSVQSNVQENNENVIQISDDDDNEEAPYSVRHGVLKCHICDLQFSTQKTLKFHMKYKHLESRLVYPCPECLDIFSTSWSVYRHLFKVHRKTAAQIRRLRESIQAKAFKMNNPPAFYEKRKSVLKNFPAQKITEEERIYQENQAWAEELEGEGEGRRCGGCGRAFERRAALAAHAHTCARRHTRRIQIQIRKDYNKEPTTPYLVMDRAREIKAEDKPEKVPEKECKEREPLEEAVMSTVDVQRPDEPTETDTREVPKQNILQCYSNTLINKLPFAQQAEKSNLNALKQRMQADVELEQLLCRKCNNKFEQIGDLVEHVAGHYKWLRYACKLCNFKHFDFTKLPEHVKVVHKLKGDTDFYYSTVKAIDGNEASVLSGPVEDLTESNETSPEPRRPSRGSSDSSRLSDDSSSSSMRLEIGSRKRKARLVKNLAKKKKETVATDESEENKDALHKGVSENDSSSNTKIFEENSSDFDEVDDKTAKRENKPTSLAPRRPVRKKIKRKNEDFEYDLSNLLKMEAQGYRDSQIVTTKSVPNKKKIQQDLHQSYDIINRDCAGALSSMSRASLERARGHMKITSFSTFNASKESRVSNIFVRPMIPKINRVDKMSPRKIENEDSKESSASSPSKVESSNLSNVCKELVVTKVIKKKPEEKEPDKVLAAEDTKLTENAPKIENKIVNVVNKEINEEKDKLSEIEIKSEEGVACEKSQTNVRVPAILPIKLRRQSLDVIQNPLIKKNITDFTKAGMKTKILVIKPINRNTDGTKTLKFQTIKLKDPNKSNSLSEDIKSDQVVVVKVPKVECALTRPKPVVNTLAIADGKCDENENEKPKNTIANPAVMDTTEIDNKKI